MADTIDAPHSALDEFLSRAPVAREPEPSYEIVSKFSMDMVPGGAMKVGEKRDIPAFLREMRQLAAAAGEEWFYRFPVKNRKENRTDYIEGPTIKLASDLARIYGNCHIHCFVEEVGELWIFHGLFYDKETGFSISRPFQQRKVGSARIGGDDDGRRLDISFQIGVSKATRNAVVHALQTYADMAKDEAKKSLVRRIGDNLDHWRAKTIEALGPMVAIERVEAVIGRKATEWLAPDVARVIAMAKAVKEGMAALNETFPPLSAGGGQSASEKLDDFSSDSSSGPARAEAGTAPDFTGNATRESGQGAEDGAAEQLMNNGSAVDHFEEFKRQIAAAPDEAALDQIWENMDIDGRFADDAKGRAQASKIINARRKELGQ